VGDSEKENNTPEAAPSETAEPVETTEAPETAAAAEAPKTPETAAPAESEPTEEGAAAAEEPVVEEPVAEEPLPVMGEPDEHGRFYGTGRRKTSIARVYLRPGSGRIVVNGRKLEEAFTSPAWREHARGPLVFAGVADQFDAQVSVKGGGSNGQAGAVRQGLARALARANPSLRPKLRQNGYLTRDPRMKERKKYGQKGARKRFQWTKR
jgi:small subunit ribosomal protein S9